MQLGFGRGGQRAEKALHDLQVLLGGQLRGCGTDRIRDRRGQLLEGLGDLDAVGGVSRPIQFSRDGWEGDDERTEIAQEEEARYADALAPRKNSGDLGRHQRKEEPKLGGLGLGGQYRQGLRDLSGKLSGGKPLAVH